jgi:hypothetical protein
MGLFSKILRSVMGVFKNVKIGKCFRGQIWKKMFGKVFKSVYEKPKTENYFLKKRYIYIYIF